MKNKVRLGVSAENWGGGFPSGFTTTHKGKGTKCHLSFLIKIC